MGTDWRAWVRARARRAAERLNITHSLQMRLSLGYSLLIAVLVILMNTYPLIMSQNLMFRSQQTALANQAVLITNTLTTADELTPETVEQAVSQLEKLDAARVVITDEAGLVLYDTGDDSAVGKYALTREIADALRGSDAFSSQYRDGTFYSRAATPVMNRNQVVGAVCLYEQDSAQGALLQELQRNLWLISLVVCLAVLVLFGAFSIFLSRRVRALLGGMRTVRAGEYTHRISMDGHDELAQLAEEFNQLTGRLQTTEEERRRFVSDASHELKTPLASIRLLTDSILQDENIDRETTREFVADIGEAADRLIHISQELLELNRLDEGRTLRREAVDLNEQVERTQRLLTPLAEEAQVNIQTRLAPGCVIRCNPEDTIQILRNLMENAIRHSHSEKPIDCRITTEDGFVRFSVYDYGIGIDPDRLANIFDGYSSDENNSGDSTKGMGIGLSICKTIVTAHGGTIEARNHEHGAEFSFTLPLEEQS